MYRPITDEPRAGAPVMTGTTLGAQPHTAAGPCAIGVDVSDDVEAFLRRWASHEARAPSAFHTTAWLRDWYGHVGKLPGVAACMVRVHRSDTGEDLMLLPLVAYREGGLRVVEFADLGITDYNAPLLTPAMPPDTAQALAVWRALRGALRGHDLLRMHKMLGTVAGQPNPLSLAVPAMPSMLFGTYLQLGDDFDAWLWTLGAKERREFARAWRVFQRLPQAQFVRVTDRAQADQLYRDLEVQQAERMRGMGHRYVLDQPAYSAFYRARLHAGLADGSVILTALLVEGRMIAGLYGLSDGTHYTMVRVGHGGDAWKQCSPGRLVMERTIHHLHAQGFRHFDFSIGDYRYKRTFQGETLPLWECCSALSWRGRPAAAWWRTRRWLQSSPKLVKLARNLRSGARARPGSPA